MTHLERYTNSIKRKPFDRIPITIQMTGETAAKLSEFTGLDNGKLIFEIFDVDLRAAGPRYIGPKPAHNDDGTFKNVYGVTFRTVSYGKGTYVESVGHPLADAETVDEIRRYNWPRADMYEYETMFDTLKMYPDYPFMVGGMAIGWDAWEMRGMEKFLEDLYTEEAIADAVINEVSDYGYELYKTICATAKKKGNANFTVVQIADDWGTQDGQLISTKMFRKFFKRHYRRIIDEAHSAGAVVQFHCCGCQLGLIPEFIGRLPVMCTLQELDIEALVQIITEPKNSLLKQYKKLFKIDGVELEIEEDAIRKIAEKAISRKTGARGLRSIFEHTMTDIMFEIPSRSDIRRVVITETAIEKDTQPTLVLADKKQKAQVDDLSMELLEDSDAQSVS